MFYNFELINSQYVNADKKNDLIERIKNGEEFPIVEIYLLYRDEFIYGQLINFEFKPNKQKTPQDAVIDFQENIKSGKLEILSQVLKHTYFKLPNSRL